MAHVEDSGITRLSLYRKAQGWLESERLYPRRGLADATWSSKQTYLAVQTRDRKLNVYRISPAELLVSDGRDACVAR